MSKRFLIINDLKIKKNYMTTTDNCMALFIFNFDGKFLKTNNLIWKTVVKVSLIHYTLGKEKQLVSLKLTLCH